MVCELNTTVKWKAKAVFGLVFSLIVLSTQSLAQSNTANIGVLAFRGEGSAKTEWQPLADYLSDTVTGWSFEIVPVTLVSASEKIRSKNLDFLITNPGHYVNLSEEFGLSALATRERRNKTEKTGLLRYGTAIFTLHDRQIEQLSDLKGTHIAAVSPDAFGGFQLAWQEFSKQGIDPFTDFEAISFMGFPQDEIVNAVKSGEVDAGVVRSGLLENLDAEGVINFEDFTVLQNNGHLEYPYKVSGPLYPEWPITALRGIDKNLREAVTVALLNTQNAGISEAYGLQNLWSAPLSYEEVRKLVSSYSSRNQAAFSEVPGFITAFILGLGMLGITAFAAFRGGLTIAQRRHVNDIPLIEDAQTDEPEVALLKERFEKLTKREREVLSMICDGQHSKEIAGELGISPKTVEYHRSNLLQKTKAGTTAHLVQLATRLEYDLGFSLGSSG